MYFIILIGINFNGFVKVKGIVFFVILIIFIIILFFFVLVNVLENFDFFMNVVKLYFSGGIIIV